MITPRIHLLAILLPLALFISACASTQPVAQAEATLQVAPLSGERTWLGPTMWGNRLQDWRFSKGSIECVTPRSSKGGWLPMRTAHELARRVDARLGEFEVEVNIKRLKPGELHPADALGGLLIGVGGAEMDPRSAAVVHQWSGNGAGVLVGFDASGKLRIRDNQLKLDPNEVSSSEVVQRPPADFSLQLTARRLPNGNLRLLAQATDPASGQSLAKCAREFAPERLIGNIALLSHPGTRAKDRQPARFGFRGLKLSGKGTVHDANAGMGAIVGTQYTLSRGVLKLTAQLMPMADSDPQEVQLELWQERGPVMRFSSKLQLPGWTANFRVPDLDASQAHNYRVSYSMPAGTDAGASLDFSRSGVIQADPKRKDELVLAVLNCNHINSHAIGGGWGLGQAADRTQPNDWVQGMWFPHAEITKSVQARKPDILFFAGDQIYEGKSPSYADTANIQLDYLYKWYLFLWAFRDLTASTPTVTIPDDHDIYQGNIWGAGGRAAKRDNEGGYVHPAAFVKMVERTQTSHLPDAFDPTPIEQGIGVYYCELDWGGVSFAVLEDRKFKSGCKGILPPEVTPGRPDHVINPDWDPSVADQPGLELLGARQESFLKSWATTGSESGMKAVLSQSPFACLSTHHGSNLVRYEADMDANGWPQAGRRRALELIREAGAVHITGDQHLAIVAQHGLDDYGDGPWSFTGPAIANFYPRAWTPSLKGNYTPISESEYLGDFLDGFGNKVSVRAVANPGTRDSSLAPSDLYDRMPGFGSVIFHKRTGQVSFECWPRGVDPSAPGAEQYAGWPITVNPR